MRTCRKGGYIPIPIYVLPIVYRFLYTKNVIPVDGVKIARLYAAVWIFFENPFSGKKNAVKDETDEDETDENETEDKMGDENKIK